MVGGTYPFLAADKGMGCPSTALKILEVLLELGSSFKVNTMSTTLRTVVTVIILIKITTCLSCSSLLMRWSRRMGTPLLGPPIAAPSAFLP